MDHRASLTGEASVRGDDPSIEKDLQDPKKMLLAVSLLSSIAQSRVGQWLRAVTTLPRRIR